jgi:hypothetical protein
LLDPCLCCFRLKPSLRPVLMAARQREYSAGSGTALAVEMVKIARGSFWAALPHPLAGERLGLPTSLFALIAAHEALIDS